MTDWVWRLPATGFFRTFILRQRRIAVFLVHGKTATVFAKIVQDSLKAFILVGNSLDFHTISVLDKMVLKRNGQRERQRIRCALQELYTIGGL